MTDSVAFPLWKRPPRDGAGSELAKDIEKTVIARSRTGNEDRRQRSRDSENVMKIPDTLSATTCEGHILPRLTSFVMNDELLPKHQSNNDKWNCRENSPISHNEFAKAPENIHLHGEIDRGATRGIRPHL